MKSYYNILLLTFIFVFNSCNDNINNPGNGSVATYKKILTVDSAGIKFELWNLNDSILYSGYNDIGLRVYLDGNEQKTGHVKFTPIMHHQGGSSHTTPVSEYFYYDSDKSLFLGYACFLMASDSSTSFWFADYIYNDSIAIKSRQFSVSLIQNFQMRFFVDLSTMELYSLTLISPKTPVPGLNELKCILHKQKRDNSYVEVDSAEMITRTWKQQTDNFIINNQNLSWIGGGKYLGNVDFSDKGKWVVNDSVKYHGYIITENPPPQFFFTIN